MHTYDNTYHTYDNTVSQKWIIEELPLLKIGVCVIRLREAAKKFFS